MIPLRVSRLDDVIRFPYDFIKDCGVFILDRSPINLLLGVMKREVPTRLNLPITDILGPLLLIFRERGGLSGITEVERLDQAGASDRFHWHEKDSALSPHCYFDRAEANRQLRLLGFRSKVLDAVYPQKGGSQLPRVYGTLKPYHNFPDTTVKIVGQAKAQLLLGVEEWGRREQTPVLLVGEENFVVDRLFDVNGKFFSWARYKDQDQQSRDDVKQRLSELRLDPTIFDRVCAP